MVAKLRTLTGCLHCKSEYNLLRLCLHVVKVYQPHPQAVEDVKNATKISLLAWAAGATASIASGKALIM